jgi:DNA-binding transcriptional LysR family regulator
VTLNKEQWLKLLDMSTEIRAFIAANEAQLKKKIERGSLKKMSRPTQRVRESRVGGSLYPPHLIGPGAVTKIVAFEPILWTSDFNVILESAYAGRGFALLPSEVVGSAIERKRLVRVFPAWHSEDVTIHLVFIKKQGLTPAVRVFIDFLAEHFRFRNDEDYHPRRPKSSKRKRG